jgi:hypothetical protein
MTKGNVGRMISTQAGAADCYPLGRTFAPREIEYVAHDHIFVRVVCPHSIGGMNRFIVKAFQIDRIRAVNSDLAIVDVRRYGSDQPKILVFVITGP